MMKFDILRYISVALAVASLSSCNLMDEKAYDFLSGDGLVENKNHKELVFGAYSTLSYPFMWGAYHEIVNFDCDYQTGPSWGFGYVGAGNYYEYAHLVAFYRYAYMAIHRSNYHADLVSRMDIPEAEKNNSLGELAFLKSWAYYNLVQLFGDVCLYKQSVSSGAPLNIPRSPVKEVWEYIIETLEFAENAMYSTHDAGFVKGHPSRGSAKALLAKVYCTLGSASMAAGEKITVSGGPAFRLDDDGKRVRLPYPAKVTFGKDLVKGYEGFDSRECYRLGMKKARELIELADFDLFESQEILWDKASKNGKEFIFTLQTLPGVEDLSNKVGPDYAGYYRENGALDAGFFVQRDHWYQLFDKTDERITTGVLHRYPYKYDEETKTLLWCYYPASDSLKVKAGTDGYKPTDRLLYEAQHYGSKLMKFRQVVSALNTERTDFNFPFIRFAEVLLLYAEADNEYNGGPSTEAIRQVEKLNRRNKSRTVTELGVENPWTQLSFRSYILEERAKEFASEGIRRFDLLRWGIYLQTMNALGGVDENDIIKRREERHLLLPLPAEEVNGNDHIKVNNPGW